MSVLVELNVEYSRFFSKGVLALARGNYVIAKECLERAAKALNELAYRRTGENRDYTQSWLFDLVKEIGNIDKTIKNEQTKEKMIKMLAEKGKLQTEETVEESRFEMAKVHRLSRLIPPAFLGERYDRPSQK